MEARGTTTRSVKHRDPGMNSTEYKIMLTMLKKSGKYQKMNKAQTFKEEKDLLG